MVRVRPEARPSSCIVPCSALIWEAISWSCFSTAAFSPRRRPPSPSGRSNKAGSVNSPSSACCRAVISASASSTVSSPSARAGRLLRLSRSSWRSIREIASARRALRISSAAAEAAADATAWRVESSRERVSSRHLSSSIWRPMELSASPAGARAGAGADAGDASGADSPVGDSSCSAAVMMREFSQVPTETPERLAASRATSRASG